MTKRLDAIWRAETLCQTTNISALMDATTPKAATLSSLVKEYVDVKGIQHNPTISTVEALISMSGDLEVDQYTRQDARNFVSKLLAKGNRTTTIRRRMNCLTAVFNYGFAEYEVSGASTPLFRPETISGMPACN